MPSYSLRILLGVVLGLDFSGVGNASEKNQETPSTSAPPPVRILMVAGGAAHDYPMRAEILAAGIRERISRSVQWSLRLSGWGHSDAGASLFSSDDWAAGADVVIHDYCFPLTRDAACITRATAPHLAGTPAVILHASTLSFPSENSNWTDFIGGGVRSFGREEETSVTGAMATPLPFPCSFPKIFRGEEVYRVTIQKPSIELFADTVDAGESGKMRRPLIWSHRYGPKEARVFVTTLGNALETLSDPWFLDLVAQGILWAINDSSLASFVKIPPDQSLSKLGTVIPKEPLLQLGPNAMVGAAVTASIWKDRSGLTEDPSGTASLAVDGDPHSAWIPASPSPGILEAELPTLTPVAAAALSWREVVPREFILEGSIDGLNWNRLIDGHSPKTEEGEIFVARFPSTDMRFIRLSVPAGGQWGVRELAIYPSEKALPSVIAVGTPTPRPLHTASCEGPGQNIRLRKNWHLSAISPLPSDTIEIPQIVPTASGEALVLLHFRDDKNQQKARAQVYRMSPNKEGGIDALLYQDQIDSGARIAWDGRRLYALSATPLEKVQSIILNESQNLTKSAALTDLRLGEDGLLHARLGTSSSEENSSDPIPANESLSPSDTEDIGEVTGLIKVERDGTSLWLTLKDSERFYLALIVHDSPTQVGGPIWEESGEQELFTWLETAQRPSIRREAITEILRRGLDFSTLLNSALSGKQTSIPPPSIITLADGLEGEQRLRWLQRFFDSSNLDLQILAMRALARSPGVGENFSLPELSADQAPELTAAILDILSDYRIVMTEYQNQAMQLCTDSNPIRAKSAQRYLRRTLSRESLLRALDASDHPTEQDFFLTLLAQSHHPLIVRGLIDRLNRADAPGLRGKILDTLVHLWGVKDPSGKSWSESTQIHQVILDALKTLRIDRGKLLYEMLEVKMPPPDQSVLVQMAKSDIGLEPLVVSLLWQEKSRLTASTKQWLDKLSADLERDDRLRRDAGLLLGIDRTAPTAPESSIAQSSMERGRHLFLTLGCAVCHDISGENETFPSASASPSGKVLSENLKDWLQDKGHPLTKQGRSVESRDGKIRTAWSMSEKSDPLRFIDRAGNAFTLGKSDIVCSWSAGDILPDCTSGKSLSENDFQALIDHVNSMLR